MSPTTTKLDGTSRGGAAVLRQPETTIEIPVKGEWRLVPALDVGGIKLFVRGQWLKAATVLDEEFLDREVEDPELCVRTLKEQVSDGLRADIFTFAQKPPAVVPKYSYPMEWDSVAAIRLTSFHEWWESLPQETRKNVRRAQKRGVVVELREFNDELVKDIVELNNDSALRQGKQFAHYGKTFEQVKKDQLSFLDRSDFICAYFGQELIGLLKLVYRGTIASVLFFLPKASHADKRPANAMLAKALELCEAKSISYLTYGRFNYGNKIDSSLKVFKIRNGFQEMLVPRYYLPLTRKGMLCKTMRLHRGIGGILPPDIISIAVSARARCYQLWQKLQRT